jgi:hypothetical protein
MPHVRHASIIITSAKPSGRLIDTPMTAQAFFNAVRKHSVPSLPAYEKGARKDVEAQHSITSATRPDASMLPPSGRPRSLG